MASISIGDCVGAGFSLIRRRPGAVFIWGLAHTAMVVLALLLLWPGYQAFFTQMMAAKSGAAPSVDMAGMSQMQGLIALVDVGMGFAGSVIYCAIFRAVLRPNEGRMAYLRIGVSELFVYLITLIFAFGIVAGVIVAAIPVAIVAGVTVATHTAGVGVLLAIALGCGAAITLVYIALRLSLAGPMTVHDGQFRLFESWPLTRGHVGALFAIILCLVAILFGGEMFLVLPAMITAIAVAASAAGGAANLPTFASQHPAQLIAGLAPWLVGAVILWIPISGCLMAIMTAPWARAYRDLVGPETQASVS